MLDAGASEFERFVVIVDGLNAGVDAVGRYRDADGNLTVVSSCDIYEFEGGQIRQITSYAVEVDEHEGPG